eukprot:gb/GECG01016758.1/.p1 GENE.gb/GECG01016758.1/~~gb/GECG01016758.1/.p1  ORF type:complete len:222 (+),score=51.42 gb/GECG01016758.1/:1-666(+)
MTKNQNQKYGHSSSGSGNQESSQHQRHVGGITAWHNEVLEEYRNSDAPKMLHEISTLSRQVQNGYVRKEEHTKELIQELQQQVHSQQEEAEHMAGIKEHRERLQKLEQDKDEVRQQLKQYKEEKENAQERTQEINQQIDAISEATEKLKADTEARIPRVKHTLSLYANISNIRWDYDNDDKISGYIAPPSSAVTPFEFDADTDSFELADRLWELIDEACDD